MTSSDSTSGLVSCIVPVHNGARFLGEALASIAAQRYQPREIIVVDDGSTDDTARVASESGVPLRYLRQEQGGGPSARNHGMRVAQGSFFAFLDADDRWHPDKLMIQMARFEARPELDISVGHVQNFWMPEVDAERVLLAGSRRTAPIPGYSASTLVARREIFARLGPFKAEMKHGEQTEWFLRARESGAEMELLPDVLLDRRLHEHNVSRHKAEASLAQYFALLKGHIERVRRDDPTSPPLP
ncbi:MAG TPA: glycosyltransferase family A protein [Gemmatimonadales bacterium]|nr:glycosyltransferase family A protein [Gemmatimonadales bacterium]